MRSLLILATMLNLITFVANCITNSELRRAREAALTERIILLELQKEHLEGIHEQERSGKAN